MKIKTIFLTIVIAATFTSCYKEYTCSCTKTDNEFPEINDTEEFTINATKNNSANKCASNEQSEETFTIECEIVG